MIRQNEEGSSLLSEVLDKKIAKSYRKKDLRRTLLEIGITAFIVYVLFGVILGIAIIQGSSMEPALKEGDIALFQRMGSNYKKGDVVILHNAVTTDYVKRVIATEGDTISIDDEDGSVILNGKKVKETYIYAETHVVKGGIEFPLTIPKGSVFLLGDNREVSNDSREFGLVAKQQIAGRVIFTIRTRKKL